MKPQALATIQAAVDFNPQRSRVTLPRQAVRDLIASRSAALADAQRIRTCAIHAEATLTMLCRKNEDLSDALAEMTADRDRAAQAADHFRQMSETKTPPALSPFDIGVILTLYPLTLAAGVLLGH